VAGQVTSSFGFGMFACGLFLKRDIFTLCPAKLPQAWGRKLKGFHFDREEGFSACSVFGDKELSSHIALLPASYFPAAYHRHSMITPLLHLSNSGPKGFLAHIVLFMQCNSALP
jgi:hypothetical protein